MSEDIDRKSLDKEQGAIEFLRRIEREGEEIRYIRIKNIVKALFIGGLAYLTFQNLWAAALFAGLVFFVLDAVLEAYRGYVLWVYRRDVLRFEGDKNALDDMLKDHAKKANH